MGINCENLMSDGGIASGHEESSNFAERLELLLPSADILEEFHLLLFA